MVSRHGISFTGRRGEPAATDRPETPDQDALHRRRSRCARMSASIPGPFGYVVRITSVGTRELEGMI